MRYLIALLATVLSLLVPVQSQAFVLTDTDDTLQVVTASGVSTITMQATWFDSTTSANTPSVSEAAVTTPATTTLVSSPAASTQRIIKNITIYNSHASSSNLITIQHYNGTTAFVQYKYTLLAGETLQWTLNEGFSVLDSLGSKKGRISFLTPNGDAMTDDTNDALRFTLVTVAAVSGNVAHGTADTPQAPVITGCQVTASVAGETLEADGDVTHCYAGRDGVPIVRPEASLEDITYAVVTATTGANTSLVAAAGAGIKTCIKYIIVNAIGTTSANYAILTDGSGGTTKADLMYSSGLGGPYRFPLPLCSTANTAWYVDSQGTETLRFTVGYYKSQE